MFLPPVRGTQQSHAVHDPKALDYIVDLFGSSRVMLGSDYPFPLGEDRPGELIDSMSDWTADLKARLLGLNALEFLGVAADRFSRPQNSTG